MPIAFGARAGGPRMPAHELPDLPVTWKQYKTCGSIAARNQLITHYMRILVRPVASRMRGGLPDQVDVEDLVQQGYLGLVDAMDRFEPERDIRFETFARRRIYGAIQDYLRSLDPLPRLTRTRHKKLQELRERFRKQHGRPPTEEELRPLSDLSDAAFQAFAADESPVLMISFSAAHPDGPAAADDDAMQSFADRTEPDPLRMAERRDLRRWLTRGFDERDRLIIILYYYEHMTMFEIGRTLGISESRVSQRLDAILGCLRARLFGVEAESEFDLT